MGDTIDTYKMVAASTPEITFQRLSKDSKFIKSDYIDPDVKQKLNNFDLKDYTGTTQIYNQEKCFLYGRINGNRVPGSVLLIMHLDHMIINSLSLYLNRTFNFYTDHQIKYFQFSELNYLQKLINE
jgi:hypothetical protein